VKAEVLGTGLHLFPWSARHHSEGDALHAACFSYSQCASLGYHIDEARWYLEIVDPDDLGLERENLEPVSKRSVQL